MLQPMRQKEGNREALLAAAKQALATKGYTGTTARDLAKAAGTSLAAIGYHFGSMDELLQAALFEAIAEWGEPLGRALSSAPNSDPRGRYEALWTQVIESFEAHRPLWSTQFELVGQLARFPHLRERLVSGQRHGRGELARLFGPVDPDSDPETARLLGGVFQALLAGVMVQWLVDPDEALSGSEVVTALELIAESLRR